MNPVANQNKIETRRVSKGIGATRFCGIECKKCGTEVHFETHGNLTPCKCGAISVDGSNDLVRVLGNPEDYEEIIK
jgi:hypothetical protein